jgi:hypothetical protein
MPRGTSARSSAIEVVLDDSLPDLVSFDFSPFPRSRLG